MNNLIYIYIYIVCNSLKEGELGACSQTHLLYNFARNIFYRALPLFLIYIFVFSLFFLTSQTSSEEVSSENERLDFSFLGAKVVGKDSKCKNL